MREAPFAVATVLKGKGVARFLPLVRSQLERLSRSVSQSDVGDILSRWASSDIALDERGCWEHKQWARGPGLAQGGVAVSAAHAAAVEVHDEDDVVAPIVSRQGLFTHTANVERHNKAERAQERRKCVYKQKTVATTLTPAEPLNAVQGVKRRLRDRRAARPTV